MSLYVKDITSSATSGTTATLNIAIQTAPNLGTNGLLLEGVWNGTGTLPSSLTDTKSNTWNRTISRTGTGSPKLTACQYLCNPVTPLTTSDTISAPFTIGNTNMRLFEIRELAGFLTLDQSTSGAVTSATTSVSTTGTGTTTVANEIAWVTFGEGVTTTSWTPTTGWSLPISNLHAPTSGAAVSLLSAYEDFTSTQSSITGDGTVAPTALYTGVIATYYATVTILPRRTLMRVGI